jgi:murein hydrolase activator
MIAVDKKILSLILSGLLFIFPNEQEATAQSKGELESRKTNTQKEIEYTNNLLQETQKSKVSTLGKVKILNTRIRLRNDLINTVNREIELIDREIEEKEETINSLGADLEKVRQDYEKLIVYTYQNRGKNERLMFILSAENFNQAYKRIKYIQQFSRHRKEQAKMIEDLRFALLAEVDLLEESKITKETLALEKKNETRSLEREIGESNKVVSDLALKEQELRKTIELKRKIALRLEKEIADLIAEEARKRSTGSGLRQLTPEEKLISESFSENKGKLPWPTERGVVTGKFGKYQHPVLKQITIQNDGIDISTVEGAKARAMFDGVVSKVVLDGGVCFIIMRHGNFLTVYQNIVELRVKTGDRVSVKQELGRIYTEKDTGSTEIHIEIWEGIDKQNPEDWLSRRNS